MILPSPYFRLSPSLTSLYTPQLLYSYITLERYLERGVVCSDEERQGGRRAADACDGQRRFAQRQTTEADGTRSKVQLEGQ